MEFPNWLNLALFVVAIVLAVIRLSYGFRAYSARKNIFGGSKQILRMGIISNFGYAAVALLLSLYFYLLYIGSGAATIVFAVMLLALLLVLIIEASFKKTG